MSDERLRELERAWRASGSWDDWAAWALETRRSSDADPWRLLCLLRRLALLELRHVRFARLLREEGQIRAGPTSDRINLERARCRIRAGRLLRLTPAPDSTDGTLGAGAALCRSLREHRQTYVGMQAGEDYWPSETPLLRAAREVTSGMRICSRCDEPESAHLERSFDGSPRRPGCSGFGDWNRIRERTGTRWLADASGHPVVPASGPSAWHASASGATEVQEWLVADARSRGLLPPVPPDLYSETRRRLSPRGGRRS